MHVLDIFIEVAALKDPVLADTCITTWFERLQIDALLIDDSPKYLAWNMD